jgi:uncharacterized protein (TIGR03083 family)
MRVDEHIHALTREGELVAQVAEATELSSPVPSCPEWTLRDLVRHTGQVHRWATAHVRDARSDPVVDEHEAWGTMPADAALVDWFREGHAGLVDALRSAPVDLACWSFLDAPSPLAFWARRQAHETAIHRADAQLAASGRAGGYPTAFAVDGIDELVAAFLTRPRGRLRSDPQRSLAVHARDADAHWTVHIGPSAVTTSRQAEAADCTIAGPASALYLLLWNRAGPESDSIHVSGDVGLLDLWRAKATIKWR